MQRVLLNGAPTSNLLYPLPPSSSHHYSVPSTSTQLIHLHPACFNLHLTFCNNLNIIRTKILHLIWEIPQSQAEKFKAVRFGWTSEHMVSLRCWFRTPTPKSILGQIWFEKFKVVRFTQKLHMVSPGYWFLLRH